MSSNNNHTITLPPIKHVFQGLFHTNNTSRPMPVHPSGKFRQRSTSSGGGYPSLENNVVEAARSLQKLSTTNSPCYRCPPPVNNSCCNPEMNMRFNGGGHRRAVSASIEIPTHPYQHYHHNILHNNNALQQQQQQQQQQHYHQQQQHHRSFQPQPQTHYRRARAHTTSGYPPTMLFQPHVYNNDNNHHKQQQITINEQQQQNNVYSENNNTNKGTAIQHHRYHCQHCRKSFSRPSSLRIHIYSHTGEKPFKCHYQGCGRSFSVHSNMRRHLRVHYYPQQQQQQSTQHTNNNNSMRLPIVPTTTKEIRRECCVTTATNVSSSPLHA